MMIVHPFVGFALVAWRLALRAIFLPTVIIATALALVACNRTPEEKKVEPASEPGGGKVTILAEAQAKLGFATAKPRRIAPIRLIEATAAIAPDPARVAHIAPIAKGRIERVHVQVGDSVNRGDPLFEYDNIELGEAIGDYRSELAELRKDLALMEHHRGMWERAQLLFEKEAIARKEVHVRETEYLVEKAAVENQYARIARVKEKLVRFGMTPQQIERLGSGQERVFPGEASYTIVRAPIAGVVIEREGAPGEVVGNKKKK